MPALALGLAIDAADEDAMQPGVEAIRVAKAAQVAPGDDERLLDRVVGEVAVVEHQLGNVEEAADRGGRELGERGPIASPCPLDPVQPRSGGRRVGKEWRYR